MSTAIEPSAPESKAITLEFGADHKSAIKLTFASVRKQLKVTDPSLKGNKLSEAVEAKMREFAPDADAQYMELRQRGYLPETKFYRTKRGTVAGFTLKEPTLSPAQQAAAEAQKVAAAANERADRLAKELAETQAQLAAMRAAS